MCGIAGILETDAGCLSLRRELEAMIGTLRHRGPDGFGIHESGPAGLAHARLSIIDLATGDQPMANEDRTVWTVFNGEIFNYVELRETLQRAGHVFRTLSDTETIVHAYEEYGDAFVDHLNGQFAIALWDAGRQRLVLARDRVGVRPLFVQRDGRRWLFSSEIKALLQVSRQPATLDMGGLAQIFTFWSAVGEQTAFAGIRSVPPGHVLSIERGRERLTRYWDWEHPASTAPVASFDEAAEELGGLLSDAVRLQLRSDVPVGSYLSGGLDSSAIAALIRRQSNVSLRTFSVAFEDPEFDESGYQQMMARHLGTEHSTIRCTRRQIGEVFPQLVGHTETPVLRTAAAPLMILASLVHQSGYKVVLTGEGADEVFAGYDLFKEAKIRRFWARQPDSRWRPQALRRLYPYLQHSPVSSGALAHSFFGQGLQETDSPFYGHMQRWITTRRTWNFFTPDAREQMLRSEPERALRELLPADFGQWPGLGRDQWVEVRTLLQGYLLSSQGDRVAMAHSVEGRVPFLDHRIIEFANRLPPHYKLRGLKEKAVLGHAMRLAVPAPILERVKQPYRAPDSQAFFHDGRPVDYVEDLLSTTRLRAAGYFDPHAVQGLLAKCRAGKALGFADNMAFVGVVSTMLLDDMFVRKRARIPASSAMAQH